MKIIYISNSFIPSKAANSVHVVKMCQAFAQNKHDISLYLPKNKKKDDINDDIFNFYNINNKFNIEKLPYFSFKGSGYFYNLFAVLKAKYKKTDLVYCRDIHTAFFCFIFNIDYILELHGPIENFSNILQYMFNYLLKDKNLKLVVITNSLKKYYLNKFPILEKRSVFVAPDGADKFQDFNKMIKLDQDKFHIGYVGHLYEGKGMEIIHPLASMCSDDIVFHIVGGTDEDLLYWKNKCKCINNIIFHGFMNQNLIPQYLNAFDVVLLPNQMKVRGAGKVSYDIAKWTSPLKLFEYMSAKKTILASDVDVLKEILKHTDNAWLCNPNNIQEWHDAILYLKNNKEVAKELANNGYIDFMKNYTWKTRVKNILSNYFDIKIENILS